MKPIFLLLALAAIASGFPAKLRWNKNPAVEGITEYRIYQLLDGKRILKATAPAVADADTKQTHSMDVQSGQVLVVTAWNQFESEPSDPVTVPVVPTKPGAVTIEITVKITTAIP